jgi:hypothetical protein
MEDSRARAVTLRYFENACPLEERVYVDSSDHPVDGDANQIIQWWTNKLAELPLKNERCIVIGKQKKIFDV